MNALWTSDQIASATGGRVLSDFAVSGVSIDTRTLTPGDLFVALSVARDGHDFVADALAKGAGGALVSRVPDGVSPQAPLVVVADVQSALEALGRAGRDRARGRVLAITGSVGKTTTKEMARTALSRQARVHAAEASYNNHWGVPLTLARLPQDADLAVIEIGMNHPGEIAPLSRMARPHAAIVTTVAPVHLEAFGVIDGIAHEKAAIYTGLTPDGIAVMPAEGAWTAILRETALRHGARIVTFGAGGEWSATDVALRGETTVVRARHDRIEFAFRLGGAGVHLAQNALAVLAACEALGFDADRAAQDLAAWSPVAGRGTRERVRLDPCEEQGLDLIDDAFNANPASVGAAISRLAAAAPERGGRRVLVLGDMLELGPKAAQLHAELAAHPDLAGIDVVHCAGPLMRALHDALVPRQKGLWAESAEALAARAPALAGPGDVVLVKGSKGARTALVVDAIRKLGHPARQSA